MEALSKEVQEKSLNAIDDYIQHLCPREDYIEHIEVRVAACLNCPFMEKCPTGRQNRNWAQDEGFWAVLNYEKGEY